MRSIRWMTAVAFLVAVPAVRGTAQCPISYGGLENAKPNKLYLYYPTTADATYPDFGFSGLATTPLPVFDAAALTGFTGTTADLRTAVTDVVRATYCEFNVQVIQTTTAPPTTFARRNTVGVTTDGGTCGSETWGLAEAVDVGDPTAVDFSKVWGAAYNCATGAGGALNGANSTLVRWARAIGGTASHEAGHNYGISHTDGLVLAAGEDVLQHHVMAAGSNFSYPNRAGYRRHFSNEEMSILAANVGLSIQTMWNWDLVNPNAQTATRLRMEFLSTQPSVVLSWSYSGPLSPWNSPAVSASLGTQVFKGTTYNRFRIEWSNGQAWSGGVAGQVPGGAQFHVGATFSSVNFEAPDAIIITRVDLLDSGGTVLALHPRVPAFDAGTPDAADQSFNLLAFNMTDRPLQLRDIVIRQLPRVMSIQAMVRGARMVDVRGLRFDPWPGSIRRLETQGVLEAKGGERRLRVARLNDKPHVRRVITERDCYRGDRRAGRDVRRCNTGVSTDLFPSTTVYLTAMVIEPQARYWNRELKRYVVGPLTTRVFYQVAGRPRGDRKRAADPQRRGGQQ